MTNVYQMVTDRIIEQMEKGIIPWQKPWVGGTGEAISYTSRKPYSILNQLLLGRPGEWLTWKQIKDRKGMVKKGAKSGMCVFFQWVEKMVENPETHEMEDCSYPILKWYHVYHIDDTEGIKSKTGKVEANPDIKPVEEAENKLAAFGNNDYSREELVAEIGSAMLCNRAGLDSEKAFKNSVGYIQSWLKQLRNDNRMIVWAAGRAEKAARYIINE